MDPLKTVHSNWDADLERYVGALHIKLDSPPSYWGRGRKYFSVIWWTDPEVWTLSSLCLHPAAFSQFILPTPPKLTPPGRLLSLCGAELPGWLFHFFFFFIGRETVSPSFGELNSECSRIIVLNTPICNWRIPPPYFHHVKMAWS